MASHIGRRKFLATLGGASAARPLAARAQQRERVRRIGVLLPAASDDAEFQARVGAFLQELSLLGWAIGRNVRIDTRWGAANADQIRRHAVELAALAPDVILAFQYRQRESVAHRFCEFRTAELISTRADAIWRFMDQA